MRAQLSSSASGAAAARIVVAGVSTVMMGVLPLLVGLFADRVRLNWQQIGWLGAAGQAGSFSGTLLAYWLLERRWQRLGIELGAILALSFALLTAAADSYPALLLCRALTSLGTGCVFAVGAYLLARTVSPARSFSIMSGVQVACGSLQAALLPWIQAHFGYGAAVASVSFWFAVILVLTLSIPGLTLIEVPVDKPCPQGPPRARFAALRLLGSIIGFQSSVVVVWIYTERIAAAAGLTPQEIGAAIAIGNLGGVPAAALGAWAGDRFGYIPLLALATAAVIGGDWLMYEVTSFAAYLTAQCIFNFGWMLGLSYYMGLLAREDAAGRTIRLAPASLVIAGALGPLCVAAFTSGNNATPILGLAWVFSITALLSAALGRPKNPPFG